MAKYNIYAGMGGSFGGLAYQDTDEFENKEAADKYARECAIEDYTSYEGYHGIRSWMECASDYLMENGLIEDEDEAEDYEFSDEEREDIDDIYTEEIEGWIVYESRLYDEDPDKEEVDAELAARDRRAAEAEEAYRKSVSDRAGRR